MTLPLAEQIGIIARNIRAIDLKHPTRVAVDGFCASGKTTVADGISSALAAWGAQVIRVSTDDFQNPPEIRWQLGQESPEGFYRHAIDVEAIMREVLIPLGIAGSLRYRTSTYDIHALRPLVSEQRTASAGDVLILDGLFLHTQQLRDHFDYSIFVDASFETCIKRACRRNQERLDTETEIERVYWRRYVPGFKMYLEEVRPRDLASTIVINDSQ